MAVRIRSRFHAAGRERSPAELASVIAALGWKLAIDAIRRMREAQYEIDVGRTYFEFVSEYLCFVAHAADRMAFARLDAAAREAFTVALVRRSAQFVEDNREMRIEPLAAGDSAAAFVDRYNRRGEDYAACDFGDDGPDFGFRRVFAAGMQELLPEKDRLWAIDQVMDIEVPEAVKALRRTLDGLFDPGAARPRREGGAVAGE